MKKRFIIPLLKVMLGCFMVTALCGGTSLWAAEDSMTQTGSAKDNVTDFSTESLAGLWVYNALLMDGGTLSTVMELFPDGTYSSYFLDNHEETGSRTDGTWSVNGDMIKLIPDDSDSESVYIRRENHTVYLYEETALDRYVRYDSIEDIPSIEDAIADTTDLIGTWEYMSHTESYAEYISFSEDGTFTRWVFPDGIETEEGWRGSYRNEGDRLILIFKDRKTQWEFTVRSNGPLYLLYNSDGEEFHFLFDEDSPDEELSHPAQTTGEEASTLPSSDTITQTVSSGLAPTGLDEEERRLVGYWVYNTNAGNITMQINAGHTFFQSVSEQSISGTWKKSATPGQFTYTVAGQDETLKLVDDPYSGRTELVVNFMDYSYTMTKKEDDAELRNLVIGRWSGTDKSSATAMLLELNEDFGMAWVCGDKQRTGTWNEEYFTTGGASADIFISFDDGENEFALAEPVGEALKFTMGDSSASGTLHKIEEPAETGTPGADAPAQEDDLSNLAGMLESMKDELKDDLKDELTNELTNEEPTAGPREQFRNYIVENATSVTGSGSQAQYQMLIPQVDEMEFTEFFAVDKADPDTIYFFMNYREDLVPEGYEYYAKGKVTLDPFSNMYEINVEGDAGEGGKVHIVVNGVFDPEKYVPGASVKPDNVTAEINGQKMTMNDFDGSSYVTVWLDCAVSELEQAIERSGLDITIADFGFPG